MSKRKKKNLTRNNYKMQKDNQNTVDSKVASVSILSKPVEWIEALEEKKDGRQSLVSPTNRLLIWPIMSVTYVYVYFIFIVLNALLINSSSQPFQFIMLKWRSIFSGVEQICEFIICSQRRYLPKSTSVSLCCKIFRKHKNNLFSFY
jgi:hypothetical protein